VHRILWEDLSFDIMGTHRYGVQVQQAIEYLDRYCAVRVVLHLLVELPCVIAVLFDVFVEDFRNFTGTGVHFDQLIIDVMVHYTFLEF